MFKKSCHPKKSQALGMTKGRAALHVDPVCGGENSRSPFDFAQGRLSTSLRFGRDDNSFLTLEVRGGLGKLLKSTC